VMVRLLVVELPEVVEQAVHFEVLVKVEVS
jgi:hypothetical protein